MDISNVFSPLGTVKSGNTVTRLSSDLQKQQWEEEFWLQQRQYKSEVGTIDVDSAKHQGSLEEKQLNSLTAEKEQPILITGNQDKVRINDLIQDLGARNNANSGGPQLNHESISYMNATINQRLEIVNVKAIKPGPALAESRDPKILPTSLVQLDGDKASVWLGDTSLQEKPAFLRKIHEALNFFGLKLKRLTIHGTQINSVEMPSSINREKENDYGN